MVASQEFREHGMGRGLTFHFIHLVLSEIVTTDMYCL